MLFWDLKGTNFRDFHNLVIRLLIRLVLYFGHLIRGLLWQLNFEPSNFRLVFDFKVFKNLMFTTVYNLDSEL